MGALLTIARVVAALAAAAGGVRAADATIAEAAYFFRAEDGSVLTLLAVETGRPAGGATGAVTIEDGGESGRTLPLEPAGAPASPGALFARTHLAAGRSYPARFAVRDAGREEVLIRTRRLDVPDLSGFSASSVVPAERFGPAGADARFHVGSEEVLPRPGAIFRRGELLRLYLQVYGAEVDEKTSLPRVDVSFRFTSDAKTRPRALRDPFKVTGAGGASMGLALPIGDWPPGAYRVDVDLHDRVSGERAAISGVFRIADR